MFLKLTISIVFLGMCFSTFQSGHLWQKSSTALTTKEISLCGIYTSKPPKELFYTERQLLLKCDYSFVFTSLTCLGMDTCFGTWKTRANEITLYTSTNLKKLINKQNFFCRTKYIDLAGEKLVIKKNYLEWNSRNNWVDTLLRN